MSDVIKHPLADRPVVVRGAEHKAPFRLEGPDGHLLIKRIGDGLLIHTRTHTGDRMNLDLSAEKLQELLKWLEVRTTTTYEGR